MLVALGDPAGRTAWTVTSPDGRTFAVFLPDAGSVRVTDAGCPHRGGPMVEGRVRDGEVRCPWHWYRFDLDTGACRTTDQHRLGVYPVIERAGEWFADVGEPPTVLSWSERLRAHARGEASTQIDFRRALLHPEGYGAVVVVTATTPWLPPVGTTVRALSDGGGSGADLLVAVAVVTGSATGWWAFARHRG